MSASPTGPFGRQLSRRRLIVGASTIGLAGVISACTPEAGSGPSPAPAPTPTVTRDPDAGRREAVAEAAVALVGTYDATISAHPTLAPLLVPLRADHHAHRAAVEPASATTAPPASPTDSAADPPSADDAPSATEPSVATTVSTTVPATGPPPGSGTPPPAVPTEPVQARAALAVAETAAADAARADAVAATDPGFARLLASITASRVLHATILRAGT